jgi:glucose/arabinose dehydrogenase
MRPILRLGVFAILLLPTVAAAQTLDDPALTVQTVVTGIDFPTTMAFIGDDDFLILQKGDGKVRRVTGGVLQAAPVLDVSVDPEIDKGLLGIAVDPDFVNNGYVFLYYSEATVDGLQAIANRVYRYTWDGAQLVDPRLVLDLPNTNRALVGGIVTFGHDDKLYTVMGSLERANKLQNVAIHADPDDTSVIFRTNTDGSAVPDNPFFAATGTLAPMKRYFAYGVRNSFGMAFDPVTGALWDTENGQGIYDEINRVDAGFNSGWIRIQGPDARSPDHQDTLWVAPGSQYHDPLFSWKAPVAPTAIAFTENPKLGCNSVHDIVIGDTNCGNLHHFVPNAARDGLALSDPALADLVADNDADSCVTEQTSFHFGSAFGVVTDIKTGPDGNLYVVDLLSGTVFRIVPSLPAGQDPDGDGVANSCDCANSDGSAWSATVEVPRVRLFGHVTTTLGWDAQRAATGAGVRYAVVSGSLSALRSSGTFAGACTLGSSLAPSRVMDARAVPAPGQGYFYLVRAGNACGAGTFGDSTLHPDPRNAIDSALPPACN